MFVYIYIYIYIMEVLLLRSAVNNIFDLSGFDLVCGKGILTLQVIIVALTQDLDGQALWRDYSPSPNCRVKYQQSTLNCVEGSN